MVVSRGFVIVSVLVTALLGCERTRHAPPAPTPPPTPRPAPAASPTSSCIPGFVDAAFGKLSVTFSGNGHTDSYDSAIGSAITNANGSIGTDATTACAISLSGSTSINGDAAVGANGFTSTSLCRSGAAAATSSSVLPAIVPLPSVVIPTVGTNQGNQTFSHGANALAPNQTYGVVSASANATLQLSAGTYVVTSLSLSANAQLVVTSGPIVIYFTSSVDLSGGGVANSGLVASNLLFFGGPAAHTATLTGGSSASFAMYAPDTDISISGNGDIYGAVVGRTVTDGGTGAIHYDLELQHASASGFVCPSTEVSRASPVIATVSNQTTTVQGSFEGAVTTRTTLSSLASIAQFSFPYLKGHMRARVASSITTSASAYGSGTVLFDAGAVGAIPVVSNSGCTPFNGSCRHVFTNTNATPATGSTWHPAVVTLGDGTASTVGALIAPTSLISGIGASQWQTIVRDVLNGSLGGVDRSTVAVIPPSTVAGAVTRPTIAYFGATDGMLHAVCASTGGSTPTQSNICPSLGTELWAFLPRVQLPLIANNTARIDGSPRVVDVFGDVTNYPAADARRFHTILTFQTGYAVGTSAAVYALDITDPAAPVVLWERATPTTLGATELGTGLGVAAGSVSINGQINNLVFLETSNAGTGGAGVVVVALAQETGAKLWQFGYVYPSPPRGVSADLPLPTGVPGGATTVDTLVSGVTTDVVFGDLYGDLWRVNAIDGTSRNGANTPLFSFSTNRHPIGAMPALYSNGAQRFAVFASGGYTDPSAAAWTTGSQYLIAARLTGTGATISETTTACATCALTIKQALTSGDKGFAQVLIVGTQLFVTSDSNDVNATSYGSVSTGHVMTFDLVGLAVSTTVAVGSGASSLANDRLALYSSSGGGQQALGTGAVSTVGPGVDIAAKLTRNVWLRTK